MARSKLSEEANARVFGRLAPWQVDLGSWVFGALIAVNLLVLAALLTTVAIDGAVIVATTSLALALPMDVAGIWLLRLLRDIREGTLTELIATQTGRDAGTAVEGQPVTTDAFTAVMNKRVRRALGFTYGVLLLASMLTLAGISAALWHIAWWIAVSFLAMTVLMAGLSQGFVLRGLVDPVPRKD